MRVSDFVGSLFCAPVWRDKASGSGCRNVGFRLPKQGV